jgi:hypothetical protein
MKAYGHKMRAPVDCCPGPTRWAVQSKHASRGARFDRDASRRAPKKAARRAARREIIAWSEEA